MPSVLHVVVVNVTVLCQIFYRAQICCQHLPESRTVYMQLLHTCNYGRTCVVQHCDINIGHINKLRIG